MNKVVWIVREDSRYEIWLLTEYSARLGRRICRLPEHERLRCPKCGKIDECEALKVGVSPKVRVRAKTDVVATREDWTIVSDRFRGLVEKHKIEGGQFVPIPSSPGFYAYVPTIWVPIDEDRCKMGGMKFENKCEQCGRYLETSGGWATRKCMQVPAGELVMFSAKVEDEGRLGRRCSIYTSETVQRIFEANGVTGVDSYLSLEDQT